MRKSSKTIASVLLIWLVLSIAFGLSGRMSAWQPPLPQFLVIILTLSSLAAVYLVPPLREWADTVSIPTLVAWHLTRLVAGSYFLVLAAKGLLSPVFALPA